MLDNLTLIDPTIDLADEYYAFIGEFIGREENSFQIRQPDGDFAAFVKQMAREARGEGMPDWCVPQHTFWCVRDDVRMVGLIKVRHYLTPALEDLGGHIGYAIRPSERRKGYATHMLYLALAKARTFGLQRVLVTCDKANRPSARVIEKNGGVLTSEGCNPGNGQPHLRYWIEL